MDNVITYQFKHMNFLNFLTIINFLAINKPTQRMTRQMTVPTIPCYNASVLAWADALTIVWDGAAVPAYAGVLQTSPPDSLRPSLADFAAYERMLINAKQGQYVSSTRADGVPGAVWPFTEATTTPFGTSIQLPRPGVIPNGAGFVYRSATDLLFPVGAATEAPAHFNGAGHYSSWFIDAPASPRVTAFWRDMINSPMWILYVKQSKDALTNGPLLISLDLSGTITIGGLVTEISKQFSLVCTVKDNKDMAILAVPFGATVSGVWQPGVPHNSLVSNQPIAPGDVVSLTLQTIVSSASGAVPTVEVSLLSSNSSLLSTLLKVDK
uniref:Uncharacterized protein n=1 Tax=viral metagenome TaxID=1070528 RepID=A0A2V0RA04_9ZZZZ